MPILSTRPPRMACRKIEHNTGFVQPQFKCMYAVWPLLVVLFALQIAGSGYARSGSIALTRSSNGDRLFNPGPFVLKLPSDESVQGLPAHRLGVLRLRGGRARVNRRRSQDDNDAVGRRAEIEASMRGKAVQDNWTKKGDLLNDDEMVRKIKEGKKKKPWREPLDKGEKYRKGRRSWEQEEQDGQDSMEDYQSADGGIGGKLEEWMEDGDSDSDIADVIKDEMNKKATSDGFGAHGDSVDSASVPEEIDAGKKSGKRHKKEKRTGVEDPEADFDVDEEALGDPEEEEGAKKVWVPRLERFVKQRQMDGQFVEVSDEWSELDLENNATTSAPDQQHTSKSKAAPSRSADASADADLSIEEPRGAARKAAADAPSADDAGASTEEDASVEERKLNGVRCWVRWRTNQILDEDGREIGLLDREVGAIQCYARKHAGSPFLPKPTRAKELSKKRKEDARENMKRARGGEEEEEQEEEEEENPFESSNIFDENEPDVILGGDDEAGGEDSNEEEEAASEEEGGKKKKRREKKVIDPVRERLIALNKKRAEEIASGTASLLDGGFVTFRDDELPPMSGAHVFNPDTKQFTAGGDEEALQALKAAGVLGSVKVLNGDDDEEEEEEEDEAEEGKGGRTKKKAKSEASPKRGREISPLERALAKKVRQIEEIEAKIQAGHNVTAAQRAKIDGKAELQAKLALFQDYHSPSQLKRRKKEEAGNVTDGSNNVTDWRPLGLHPLLLLALRNVSFTAPTPIQYACIRAALREGCDVIGVAETGAGKTLAFALPILHSILSRPRSDPLLASRSLVALIVCPTRELALQVTKHIAAVGGQGKDKVRAVAIVGGLSEVKQVRQLKLKPPIIVGTPGRLWELVQQGEEHLVNGLRTLRFIVLDEADRLVSSGHFKEVRQLLARLPEARGLHHQQRSKQERNRNRNANTQTVDDLPPRQGFLFSATYEVKSASARALLDGKNESRGRVEEREKGERRKGGRKGDGGRGERKEAPVQDRINMVKLAKKLLKCAAKPRVIDVTSDRVVAEGVKQVVVKCTPDQKDDYLYFFLRQNPGRSIVFVNHISLLRRLTALLVAVGIPARPLHSAMQQRARLRNIDLFRNSEDVVLVATDVAARGLDIPHVQHVVHFDVPQNADTYTHRSGRAAHQPGAPKGFSVLLVNPRDAATWAKARGITDGFKGAMRVQVHSSMLKQAAHLIVLGRRLKPSLYSLLGTKRGIWYQATLRLSVAKGRASTAWKKKAADELEVEDADEEESQDSQEQKPESARNLERDLEEIKKLEREIAEILPTISTAPPPARAESGLDETAAAYKATDAAKSNGTAPAELKRPTGVIVGGRAQLDWLRQQERGGSSRQSAAKPKRAPDQQEGKKSPDKKSRAQKRALQTIAARPEYRRNK